MSLQDHQYRYPCIGTDTLVFSNTSVLSGPSVPIPKGQYRYPRYRYPKPSTDTPYVVFQQADSSEQFEYRYSKGVSIPMAGTDTLRMGTDTLEQRSATVICNG
ncbi:hypothetical protein GQ457_13G012110 [Hibiscus cannabinus]